MNYKPWLVFFCVLLSGCTMAEYRSYRERSAERKERELEARRAIDMHNAMEEAVEAGK